MVSGEHEREAEWRFGVDRSDFRVVERLKESSRLVVTGGEEEQSGAVPPTMPYDWGVEGRRGAWCLRILGLGVGILLLILELLILGSRILVLLERKAEDRGRAEE